MQGGGEGEEREKVCKEEKKWRRGRGYVRRRRRGGEGEGM